MKVRIKFFLMDYYLWIILLLILFAAGLLFFFLLRGYNWTAMISIIGGLFSAIYFIQKQELDEAKLFKELFLEFNRRYDYLNEKLNNIIRNKNNAKDLGFDDINTLYDYFNLCGEEYLFYKKGYIYPKVWRSWVRGMKVFYEDERIQKKWLKEFGTESYYGFDLSKEISKLPNKE